MSRTHVASKLLRGVALTSCLRGGGARSSPFLSASSVASGSAFVRGRTSLSRIATIREGRIPQEGGKARQMQHRKARASTMAAATTSKLSSMEVEHGQVHEHPSQVPIPPASASNAPTSIDSSSRDKSRSEVPPTIPPSPPPAESFPRPSSPPRRPRAAPLQLTERAVSRIKELLASKGPSVIGVRLGTKRRGCNGLSYTMNYAETRPKFDEEVQVGGVTVFVEPSALMHVVGTEMDYEETELSREFTFNNPNAKGQCGCGESFNV